MKGRLERSAQNVCEAAHKATVEDGKKIETLSAESRRREQLRKAARFEH
jgi:hypothetical protein